MIHKCSSSSKPQFPEDTLSTQAGRQPRLPSSATLTLPYNFRPGQVPAYPVYPPRHEWAIKPVTKHFTRHLGEIKNPTAVALELYSTVQMVWKAQNKAS